MNLPPFIHLIAKDDSKEILINVSTISKIEVTYYVPGETTNWKTSLTAARENPEAFRVYRVFVGGEEILLPANPNSESMKLLEEIYKTAIKT
jgi:hypothetical protein